jgi:hypothetical protein
MGLALMLPAYWLSEAYWHDRIDQIFFASSNGLINLTVAYCGSFRIPGAAADEQL